MQINLFVSFSQARIFSIFRRIFLAFFGLILSTFGLAAFAQTEELQTGLHYFSIEDLDTDRVIQRGTAGSGGFAFNRLILAPNTRHRARILQAATLRVGEVEFTTPGSGRRLSVPDIFLREPNPFDADSDGLHQLGEFIMGTDANNPDTDADGVLDGAEVQQGTDPNSGRPVRTGIIATVDTPGTAVDVCAINNPAIVADSGAGVSVFNVFNGMNPTIIARVDTPGSAQRVACAGNLIAVADGPAGLAVIDISDPPAARIIHQVSLGGAAQAVTAAGGVAYVGLSTGKLVSVDLATGTIVSQVAIPGNVQDVALGGDHLYALTTTTLHAIALFEGDLQIVGSVDSRFFAGPNRRLFVGDEIAYATHGKGYNTFAILDPAQPVLITETNTTQFGWKQVVDNGSGIGVAAVSPNQAFDGPHNVSLFDVTNPIQTNVFITEFETPSVARAVTIFNGLAYVADHAAGMHVINYLAFDAQGQPPTIELAVSFPLNPAQAEEGKSVRVTANVTDDVQVRNVEFYVDGVKVATDGNFPFEHRFTTPLLAQQERFILCARASDTGGNATFTNELVVTLVPDATPPRVTAFSPRDGAVLGRTKIVAAFFSEPIDPATLKPDTFFLREVGADGIFNTDDDGIVNNGVLEFRDDVRGAFMNFEDGAPPGNYLVEVRDFYLEVTTEVADLAGNPVSETTTSAFQIFDIADDRDGDGVPDALEVVLGLDPDNADTNGDGTPDGQEDFDNDGLSNLGEVLLDTDPTNADTDEDGILDGAEDADEDGLSDGAEI